ncbi:phage baseplate assembly protein V [Acetobacter lovaniensis]|uniref:Phage baseplate assembly protein V n=1 Tax=Acetobacter lovaniensis TaxID=104100 RepID=A0A841QLA4_9PROT|nr:phage baseplate assembly protein V [Acetobacter lovaniensis]MBB6458707.1 phage baseplate assembly protein V [Acetobacter lovaniensis]NHN82912.1 phage baseplate assembly protein V [Acetobacter lovaniensis]GBQ66549.1 Mu-like prophage protein gp45 [Acetobacter lovaniensis NRIC 0474]
MSYDFSDHSRDKINTLTEQSIQFIKPARFLKHTAWKEDYKSHVNQISMFGNTMIRDDTRLMQHYGFTSAPLAGANALVHGIMGSNSNNVITGTHDERYTPRDLQPGEVVLFDYQGQSIELRHSQTINISSMKTTTINIDGKNQITITDGQIHITGNATIDRDVEIDGNLHVKGNVTCDSDVTASGISLKSHTHASGAQGSPTSPPQ